MQEIRVKEKYLIFVFMARKIKSQDHKTIKIRNHKTSK